MCRSAGGNGPSRPTARKPRVRTPLPNDCSEHGLLRQRDRRAGRCPQSAQAVDLLGEPGRPGVGAAAARPRAGLPAASNSSAQPPIWPASRSTTAAGPAGGQRRPGELLLGGGRAADRRVLVGGQGRRDRAGQRDERRLPRHLEHREPRVRRLPPPGPRAPRRGSGRCPARARRPRPRPGARTYSVDRGSGGERQPGGQQQLPALEERRRIGQLADVHPGHRPVHRCRRGCAAAGPAPGCRAAGRR